MRRSLAALAPVLALPVTAAGRFAPVAGNPGDRRARLPIDDETYDRASRCRRFSFEPVWSPNGKRIAFAHATRTTPPHIWTMNRNGKRVRQATRGPKPDVRPDSGSR